MFDLTDAFACLAILLLSFLLFQWRKRSSFCRLMDKIPGYSGIEAIKVMSNMNSKGIDKFYQSYLEIVRSFESASKIYVWPYLFVTIRDAEDVKIILNDKNCNEKHLLHKRFFNDGLVTLFGEKYRLRKKVVKEAFYPAFVKGHLPTIVAKTMSCLNRLEATPRKGEFDILESIFDFTLDVFLSTTLGRGDVDDHLRQKYVEDAAAIKILLNEKMIKFWLFPPFLQLTSLHRRSKKLLNSMESFAELMINDLESEYQRDPKAVLKGVEPLSYLTQLYTIRNTMTHQEVINEMISILFAGFETSGITIAAIVLCIAMHEDVQAKVVAELDEIFLFDDEINEEKLDKMIYMETVIKESMRLFPLSPMYGRQATEDVPLTNFTIPASTYVTILIHELHTDTRYWGNDALQFKPDRFARENDQHIYPYSYVPFSQGPRACLGYRGAWMVMKIFLTHLLRKYKLSSSLKLEDITIQTIFTIHVPQGFLVSLTPK